MGPYRAGNGEGPRLLRRLSSEADSSLSRFVEQSDLGKGLCISSLEVLHDIVGQLQHLQHCLTISTDFEALLDS